MASPTLNSVPTTDFDPLSTGEGRYLAWGTKWGGALGTGVTLTYSFPGGISGDADAFAVSDYGGSTSSEWDAWISLSSGERAAVRTALSAWSAVANITFDETVDNENTVGVSSAQFWKSTDGVAHDTSDRIVYETDSGKLFYDRDGSGAAKAVQIALLSKNLALTNLDFFII